MIYYPGDALPDRDPTPDPELPPMPKATHPCGLCRCLIPADDHYCAACETNPNRHLTPIALTDAEVDAAVAHLDRECEPSASGVAPVELSPAESLHDFALRHMLAGAHAQLDEMRKATYTTALCSICRQALREPGSDACAACLHEGDRFHEAQTPHHDGAHAATDPDSDEAIAERDGQPTPAPEKVLPAPATDADAARLLVEAQRQATREDRLWAAIRRVLPRSMRWAEADSSSGDTSADMGAEAGRIAVGVVLAAEAELRERLAKEESTDA